GTNYAIETAASLDFANAAQRGAGHSVIRAQGKAVTNRAAEWWVVVIRCDGLRQYATAGARELDRFRSQRAAQGADRSNHLFAGLLVREHFSVLRARRRTASRER